MLKPTLAIALPAIALGVALAHMPPELRATAMAAVRSAVGGASASVAPGDRSSFAPQPPPTAISTAFTTTIEPDRFGQYDTVMEIGGRQLPALVDTGASYVALSFEDAASIGIHPAALAFTGTMHTANGVTKVAFAMIPHIRVGNVEAYDVRAVISQPGALTLRNLLGMSFLTKLTGFRVDSGRLVLRQ